MADNSLQNDGIISDPLEILKALVESKEHDNFIGIWTPRLGSGFYLCKIEHIREGQAENDKVIIISEKDQYGKPIQTNVIYLKEILKVHLLKKMN
jgi:hypothetical protein